MSAETEEAMLRPMLPADVPVLAAIYQASIEDLTAEDYDENQRLAWSAAADDEATFGKKLGAWLTLVATVRGAPVGVVALEGREKIRMLYVYPRAARRGIATLLLNAIERLAAGRGSRLLDVEASDTARPFFEVRGFTSQSRQTASIGDQWLGNMHMTKVLKPL